MVKCYGRAALEPPGSVGVAGGLLASLPVTGFGFCLAGED